MQPQQQLNPEHAYLALGILELRCKALRQLLEAFTLHGRDVQRFYSRETAQSWIDEGNRLLEKAEKVLKEEEKFR